MTSSPTSADGRRPHRLARVPFESIGEEGRAELVERRLADAITGGHLPADERLPSEAELARTLGVATVTVREALLGLRARGLVVTRRGRHGGSFVSGDADPLAFARTALLASSRVAIRDLGAHYSAITTACVRLAARRAVAGEVRAIRARLARLADDEAGQWRRTMDDLQIELVALSQSARLTREQMRLQAELSPLLRLVDIDPDARSAQRDHFGDTLTAVEAGDELAAGQATERSVAAVVDALITIRSQAE